MKETFESSIERQKKKILGLGYGTSILGRLEVLAIAELVENNVRKASCRNVRKVIKIIIRNRKSSNGLLLLLAKEFYEGSF